MSIKRLWAPWRVSYTRGKKTKKCIFCKSISASSASFVIYKTKHSVSLLNIYPYNNGHAMIAPRRHVKELAHLKEAEILDLVRTLNRTQMLLDKVLNPEGYNIGINISESAGAGIVGHLHIHLVPRWKGDTNFMPILSNTKVISQALDDLYKQLKHAQSKIH